MGLERHLQTVIQLLLVALLYWAGAKLVELTESHARMQERLTYQASQIDSISRDLRDWSSAYYLKSAADRDLGEIKNEVRNLSDRVSALEGERR